jgi:hypothetical protein
LPGRWIEHSGGWSPKSISRLCRSIRIESVHRHLE